MCTGMSQSCGGASIAWFAPGPTSRLRRPLCWSEGASDARLGPCSSRGYSVPLEGAIGTGRFGLFRAAGLEGARVVRKHLLAMSRSYVVLSTRRGGMTAGATDRFGKVDIPTYSMCVAVGHSETEMEDLSRRHLLSERRALQCGVQDDHELY